MSKGIMTFKTSSVAETQALAVAFSRVLKPGMVLAYFGGLGAGKTAFTRGLAKGLNVKGEVSSPTFALVHEYQGDPPLIHFDMYRISSEDDLYTTGYFDYLDGNNIVAIEWSENIEDFLPENTIRISFEITGENSRWIVIEGGPDFEYSCH